MFILLPTLKQNEKFPTIFLGPFQQQNKPTIISIIRSTSFQPPSRNTKQIGK